MLRSLIGLLSAIAIAPSERGSARDAAVIVGKTSRLTFVALEQDLHPGEDELYLGELYDVRVRDVRVLVGDGDVRDLRRLPIRAVMTHPSRKPRPIMMFVLRHEEGSPVAVWWDWTDDGRTCVPSETVERFAPRLLAAAKAGKLCAG